MWPEIGPLSTPLFCSTIPSSFPPVLPPCSSALLCGITPEALELPEWPKDQTQKGGIQKSGAAQSRGQVCGTTTVWPEAVPSPMPLVYGLCCCWSWSWKNIHLAFNVLGPMGPMSFLLGKPELEGGSLSVAKWPQKGTCLSSCLWGRRARMGRILLDGTGLISYFTFLWHWNSSLIFHNLLVYCLSSPNRIYGQWWQGELFVCLFCIGPLNTIKNNAT